MRLWCLDIPSRNESVLKYRLVFQENIFLVSFSLGFLLVTAAAAAAVAFGDLFISSFVKVHEKVSCS